MEQIHVIADTRDRVGESPVWSVTEQALYWVDIEGRCIRRWDSAADTVQSWPTAERVGCIALSARGGLVAAMESGVFAVTLLAAPALRTTLLAGITHPQANMRFNDGRCDRQGRFWLSTMCMDMGLAAPVGAVFCLDEAGLSPARVNGLITPNGMAFSPDGRCYYLSDSHPSVQKIWAFELDPPTGALSQRREFVDMTPLPRPATSLCSSRLKAAPCNDGFDRAPRDGGLSCVPGDDGIRRQRNKFVIARNEAIHRPVVRRHGLPRRCAPRNDGVGGCASPRRKRPREQGRWSPRAM